MTLPEPFAVRLLLTAANAAVGAQEAPVASNGGAYVERVLAKVGLSKGAPWCAAAVSDWLDIALGSDNPVPKTGGCAVIGEWAIRQKCLVTVPRAGDLFLIYHPELKRFAHVGVVETAAGMTISGNTTRPGQAGDSREGWVVAKKLWTFKPDDRFVRWTKLLGAK